MILIYIKRAVCAHIIIYSLFWLYLRIDKKSIKIEKSTDKESIIIEKSAKLEIDKNREKA